MIEIEGWKGGWEGSEENMKYKKPFNLGSHRLGNLINKHNIFSTILNINAANTIVSKVLNKFYIGGMDLKEPLKGYGLQNSY